MQHHYSTVNPDEQRASIARVTDLMRERYSTVAPLEQRTSIARVIDFAQARRPAEGGDRNEGGEGHARKSDESVAASSCSKPCVCAAWPTSWTVS
jgi:hypothetical protein